MPLVNAHDLLQHAYQNQYAIAGIGITDFELAHAAVQAASQTRAPIILNLVDSHRSYLQFDALLPGLVKLCHEAEIPIAVHYDHAKHIDTLSQAIRLGCNSVMYEPQTDNLLDAQAQISQLQSLCAQMQIPLETIAGHVSQDNQYTTELHADLPTQPATAKYLLQRTGVQALAVSVGNQHGLNNKQPKIDFARLKRIHQETACPLVIHGGSGLTEDQCIRLTRKGVAKINFFSDLAKTLVDQRKKAKDYFSHRQELHAALTLQIEHILRLVGSAGRAAEILQQCRIWGQPQALVSAQCLHWQQPEHLIIQPLLDRLSQHYPCIQSIQTFYEPAPSSEFSVRVSWLFQLNQQQALAQLSQFEGFNTFLQTLRGLASEVRLSENSQDGLPS